nr:hypothetical protein [Borreliella garinii]
MSEGIIPISFLNFVHAFSLLELFILILRLKWSGFVYCYVFSFKREKAS